MVSRRSVIAALAAATSLRGLRPAAAATADDDSDVPRFTRSHDFVQLARVPTGEPVVAMTFDDGPHPTNTPVLLDMLRQRGLRATFFMIGALVARYPDIVARVVDEGHEIGNHTWSHPFLSSRSDTSVLRELDRTTEAVWRATGTIPVTMRPPYGAITRRQTRMIHANRNLPSVMWSVDPQDWRRPGSAVVASRIVGGAHRGAIILAHDIHTPTIQAMPSAFDGLIGRGFGFVTMSSLLGWGGWGPGAVMMARAPAASAFPALQ